SYLHSFPTRRSSDLGRRRVDADDASVSMGRPDEGGVEHARQRHVVDEAALAAQKPRVFAPLHRRPEKFRAHQLAQQATIHLDAARAHKSPGPPFLLGFAHRTKLETPYV